MRIRAKKERAEAFLPRFRATWIFMKIIRGAHFEFNSVAVAGFALPSLGNELNNISALESGRLLCAA